MKNKKCATTCFKCALFHCDNNNTNKMEKNNKMKHYHHFSCCTFNFGAIKFPAIILLTLYFEIMMLCYN